MEEGFSRRFVLGALLAGAADRALAGAPLRSIEPGIRPTDFERHTTPSPERLIAEARLDGRVAYAVADAETGQILESRAPLRSLPPASTAKAVTALYALDRLGPDHRFETSLVATGPIEDGKIQGDLILVGGGDPTLDTDGLGALASDLKDAGIHEVTGKFIVDPAVLPAIRAIDQGQPPHVGYNPSVGGLNLNYNRVHFEWKRNGKDYEVTMDARTARFSPNVLTAQMRVVDRKGPVYTYSAKNGIDEWTVARGALGPGGSRWLPVRRPDLYAAEVFQTLARSHGIVLKRVEPGSAPAFATVLATHRSEPLNAILHDMLLWSTNLTAEVVGLTATRAGGGDIGSLAGSAGAMNDWVAATYGVRRPSLLDHSGLSGKSRIAPVDMVRVMAAARQDGALKPILKAVPLRGDDAQALQSQGVEVRAKTGTLHFVSALTGYVNAPDQRELAFAILTADTELRDTLELDKLERPDGARAWAGRSRLLQNRLIARWVALHGRTT